MVTETGMAMVMVMAMVMAMVMEMKKGAIICRIIISRVLKTFGISKELLPECSAGKNNACGISFISKQSSVKIQCN